MSIFPSSGDIKATQQRIKNYIHKTPVLTSRSINKILGSQIYFKCENMQKAGAFKYRGATNAILSLAKDEAQYGVATHSSGNHGAALTLAARQQGVDAGRCLPGQTHQ